MYELLYVMTKYLKMYKIGPIFIFLTIFFLIVVSFFSMTTYLKNIIIKENYVFSSSINGLTKDIYDLSSNLYENNYKVNLDNNCAPCINNDLTLKFMNLQITALSGMPFYNSLNTIKDFIKDDPRYTLVIKEINDERMIYISKNGLPDKRKVMNDLDNIINDKTYDEVISSSFFKIRKINDKKFLDSSMYVKEIDNYADSLILEFSTDTDKVKDTINSIITDIKYINYVDNAFDNIHKYLKNIGN